MKATIRLAIGLCVILALTLGLGSSAVAALGADSGSPVLNKITFVHRTDQAAATVIAAAKPANTGKTWYKYSGIHWDDSRIPVNYVVDDSDNDTWLAGLKHHSLLGKLTISPTSFLYARITLGRAYPAASTGTDIATT